MEGVTFVRSRSLAFGVAASIAAVAVVTGAIYALREVMPVSAAGVLYLLPVLLASTYWGLTMGVGTAVLSALAFNFFHIPPTGRFTIGDEQNWVALIVFFAAAALVSTLAGSARARAEEAKLRSREADLSAEMARVLLGGTQLEDSLRVVGQRIAAAFDLAWVEVDPSWIDSDARRRALPVVVEGSRAGTVAVPRDTPEAVVEAIRERVVPSLETLLTAARGREGLEAQVIETKALRRSNVVKTALLRSVSHDLRSPLTAITTASAGLSSPTLSDEEREELSRVITEESARLTRLVDDLLDLTRIQAGSVEPKEDWASAEELVEAVTAAVPEPPGGWEVAIEPGLPLFPADSAQIERALENVVGNAIRFGGGTPVTISAKQMGRDVAIRVSDRGPGVAREDLEAIFEPFHKGGGDAGGTGLGLAIARGFVEANGGSLRAQSLPGQGTTFVMRLPQARSPREGERARTGAA
jgi:two-component system sensor histidine kinase KdpD